VTGRRGRPSRRNEIVTAAETLLNERGLSGMTTRAIAEAVPCSEGAIYVHFEDRLSLVLEVLQESLPEIAVPVHGLLKKLGTGDPEQNLVDALGGLARFYRRVTPMLCALTSEPELLKRFQKTLGNAGKGPHRSIAMLASYIEGEQKLGRIDGEVNAKVAANVLMATPFLHEFTALIFGSADKLESKRLVRLALRKSDATGSRMTS